MSLIVPTGGGWSSIDAVRAGNAVSDYDPDLILGRDQETGLWRVYMRNGPEGQPFPVYTIGRELPSYDELQRRLYQADVRRHGHKIVEQVQRRVDARQASLEADAHDVSAETAERIEHGMRKLGMLPNLRIFVPS